MAKCKKVLSIVLCLAMLLGTLTIGIFSTLAEDATTTTSNELPTYAALSEKYKDEKFFYAGITMFDNATGDPITDTVVADQLIDVYFYVKSNYDIYGGIYYVILDKGIFSLVTKSTTCIDTGAGMANTGATVASAAALGLTKSDAVANGTLTSEQYANWLGIKISDNKNATYVRNTKGDTALCKFQVKVNANPAATKTGFDGATYFFNECYTTYSGKSLNTAATHFCNLGGTTATDKIAKADNFETSLNREIKIATAYKFVDGETTVDTVVASDGDKIDLDKYVPTADGKTFKTWSLNGIAVSGEYTANKSAGTTFTAIWEGDTSKFDLMTVDGDGEWVKIAEYYGTEGAGITMADLDSMLNYVKTTKYDDIVEAFGVEGVEPTVTGLFFNKNGAKGNLKVASQSMLDTFGITFGGTVTEIFVNTTVEVKSNIWYPVFDENGLLVEGEWNQVGETTSIKFETALDGKYKYSGTALADYQESYTKGTLGEDSIDTNLYSISYRDGNGQPIIFDQGISRTGLGSDRFTEGSPLTHDFYTVATPNKFYVAIEAGNMNYVISTQAYDFGDEVTADAFTTVFASDDQTSGTIQGEFNFSELYDDGTKAKMPGYKLNGFSYTKEDGTVIDLMAEENNSFSIDPEAVNTLLKGMNVTSLPSGAKVLVLKADWEPVEYEFTVMYQNAAGKWVKLGNKTYTGSANVSPADFLDTDMIDLINTDILEGTKVSTSGWTIDTDEGEKLVSSVKSYEGPYTLKIYYLSDKRSAFISYNNLKEGAEAIQDTNYKVTSLDYGTVLYVKDFDYEDENAGVTPLYNQFLDPLRIPTSPKLLYKTDKDGNIVYEQKQQEVYEDDGVTPKRDATGAIVMEYVFDEEGNPVYDESKPIVQADPKGECVYRPYRNCEYMGYKVYHTDEVYTDYSSLMAAKDQGLWKEGYETKNNELFTTTVIEMQWKSDAEFKSRVFDDNMNLYSAKGKDGKKYYWNDNGIPCAKGESPINHDETTFILYFRKGTEQASYGTDAEGNEITGELTYKYAFTLGLANLHPRFIPDLFPTLIKLIKGLL